MDCSDLIESIRYSGLKSGFMGIYADQNGVFEGVEFNEQFKKRVFDQMMLCQNGYKIEDYLGDKLGMVWFSFENDDERKQFIENREHLFTVKLSSN